MSSPGMRERMKAMWADPEWREERKRQISAGKQTPKGRENIRRGVIERRLTMVRKREDDGSPGC